MTSTYTQNTGLEKPATGDQSGTWSGTLNTNFDLIDESTNGLIAISLSATGSTGTPNTLAITNGSSSNGRNAFIDIDDTGTGDLGGDVYLQLTPNDAEKICYIKNSLTTQDLYVFQGTYDAGRDYTIANGLTALLRFTGGGASASSVLPVNSNMQTDGTITNNGTITTGGSVAATGTVTGSNLSGTNTGDEVPGTTTTAGVLELATQTEFDAKTDTSRAVTTDTIHASRFAVTKPSEQTYGGTNTNANPDDDLVFPVEANTDYAFRATVFYEAESGISFGFGWVYPSGTTMSWSYDAVTTVSSESGSGSIAGTAATAILRIEGSIHSSATTGNVVFRWWNGSPPILNCKVKKGSSLITWK